MTTHTPGPWTYNRCSCGHPSCNKFKIGHSGAEGMFEEADARLIAAAPDLLEALEELLGDPGWGCHRPTYLKARAAIAKAKGEA